MSLTGKRPTHKDGAPAVGRRRTLALGAAGLLGGLASAAARGADVEGAAAPDAKRTPSDVGRKFNADGTVRPFAGNTFVGRIPQQGPRFAVFDALLDIYREVPAHGFASKLTLTPPSSYHVTLFGGVNDADRHTPHWGVALPEDTPIGRIDALYLERLRRRPTRGPQRDFEFVLDAPPGRMDDGLYVPLRPADAATASRLRALRDELAALTGLRRPDHDRYQYHVTLGYLHAFLDERESADLQRATADWIRRIDRLGATILIPSFHYCTFRDMFAFEEKWEV